MGDIFFKEGTLAEKGGAKAEEGKRFLFRPPPFDRQAARKKRAGDQTTSSI